MDESNGFKFSCPHCGQHLEAEADMAGMSVDCPGCGQPLEVPANGDTPHKGGVPDAMSESEESSDASSGIEGVRPRPPVITVIKRRESIVDGFKKRLKAIGIGIASLCLFAGVGMMAQIDNGEGGTVETVERRGIPGDYKGTLNPFSSVNTKVLSSVECLLSFMQLPNERRWQVLSDSLQVVPNDVKTALGEYLVSVRKKPEDMMSSRELEEARLTTAGAAIFFGLLGAAVDDSQGGVAAGLQVGDLANAELQENARQRLRQEIETKRNRLIEIVKKYGVDSNALEEALVGHGG